MFLSGGIFLQNPWLQTINKTDSKKTPAALKLKFDTDFLEPFPSRGVRTFCMSNHDFIFACYLRTVSYCDIVLRLDNILYSFFYLYINNLFQHINVYNLYVYKKIVLHWINVHELSWTVWVFSCIYLFFLTDCFGVKGKIYMSPLHQWLSERKKSVHL